jgi:hypothetical protein
VIAVAPDDDIPSFSHRDRSRRITPADAPARTILAQGARASIRPNSSVLEPALNTSRDICWPGRPVSGRPGTERRREAAFLVRHLGYDSEEQSNCPFAPEVPRARSRSAQPANGTSRCR